MRTDHHYRPARREITRRQNHHVTLSPSSTAVVTITDCKFTALTDGIHVRPRPNSGGTVNASNFATDGSAFDGSQDFLGNPPDRLTLTCISNEFTPANGDAWRTAPGSTTTTTAPALAVGAHSTA